MTESDQKGGRTSAGAVRSNPSEGGSAVFSPAQSTGTSPGKRLRLAFLTNIPSPYRAVMARAWANLNPHLAITVFYTDPDDQGRNWAADPIGCGVHEQRLPVVANLRKYGKLNSRLVQMVRDHDVVMIGGFEQASYLVAALLARAAGKPVVMLFDGFSPVRFAHEPAPIMALKRFTARQVDAFFANGTVGRRYVQERARAPSDRGIYNQFLSHRDEPIAEARCALAGMTKVQIRERLGINAENRKVLLSCGYLIERKRNDLVIDAIARLPDETRPLLLVVGSGDLEESLRDQAQRVGVPTHFAGFKLGRELAEFYFAADGLVLASSDDPWGMVVNEAMSVGLPVLVSDACGAALDLVRDGANGYVFRTGDVADCAAALERMLAGDLAAMGRVSEDMIAEWTPTHSAENLSKAVADAVERSARRR